MKVVLVSQPGSDGVFRHVEALSNYLLSQNVQVHLAYSDRDACDQLSVLVKTITAAGGKTLNLRVGNQPSPADLPALLNLHRFVGEIGPEVVHAHSSKAGALVRGLSLVGRKARVFYTPHAYYRMNAPGGAKARIFHGIERLLKHVGTTLTCSPDEAAFASDRIGVAPGKQKTIANGVDCARFRPPTGREVSELRSQFAIPGDALVLGTAGRFSPQKDPITTYTALAKIAEEVPNLFFVHLGKGEMEGEVDRILALHGLQNRCRRISYLADSSPFYRMLDGFVLASLYEGMSYAVIEALASNLPIILTKAPGNQGFEGYGLSRMYWAKPGNAESLEDALRAWALDVQGRAKPPNHREIVLEHFSSDAGYARILAAYRSGES